MAIQRTNIDQAQVGSRLSDSEWHDLRGLIHTAIGIKLTEPKRALLVSRLLKRLKATGASSFRDYFRLVVRGGASSAEHQQLINAITTNKTDFFREQEHFDVFARWLETPSPDLQRSKAQGLRIWCAATSTGEEPYTIAAVLREHLTNGEWRRATVLASDIDTAVLETARRGVYGADAVECVDAVWRMKMFSQGTGAHRREYRVKRDLREHVSLFQHNLIQKQWSLQGEFDAIFCRNVLIYFDRPTQERVVRRLLGKLARHGLLFLGHAESINNPALSVRTVAHAVYGRKDDSASDLQDQASPVDGRARAKSQHMRHASGEQVRRLQPEQVVVCARETLEVDTTHGAVLLVYDKDLRSNAVAHCSMPEGGDFSSDLLRHATRLAKAVLAHGSEGSQLVGKLLVVSSAAQAKWLDIETLVARLAEVNIDLVAVRHLEEPSRMLIDAERGRVRLERVRMKVNRSQESNGDDSR